MMVRCVDVKTGHTLFEVPDYRHNSSESLQQAKMEECTGDKPDDESLPAVERVPRRRRRTLLDPIDSIDPIVWTFLEAEATIRASLSLPEEQRTSSFASSRIDLSLVCPDSNSHDQMDEFVQDLARMVHADVVRLDANDIEELTNEYVGSGRDSPGTFSTLGYDVFDGYEASNLSKSTKQSATPGADEDELDMDEDELDEEEDEADARPGGFALRSVADLYKMLRDSGAPARDTPTKPRLTISSFPIATIDALVHGSQNTSPGRSSGTPSSTSANDYVHWDDARLTALLDSLLDAPTQKESGGATGEDPALRSVSASKQFASERLNVLLSRNQAPKDKENARQIAKTKYQLVLRSIRSRPPMWKIHISKAFSRYAASNLEKSEASVKLEFRPGKTCATQPEYTPGRRRTIIHVRDLQDIGRWRLGDEIVRRLVHVVRKRRAAGESVLVVGTSAQEGFGTFATSVGPQKELPFRTMHVPPLFLNSMQDDADFVQKLPRTSPESLKDPAYARILEINLRHIQSMLRRLRPSQDFDLMSVDSHNQMSLPGTRVLSEKVLSLDHVQRLALTAIGLSQTHARSETVLPIHVALATLATSASDNVTRHWISRARRRSSASQSPGRETGGKVGDQQKGASGPDKLEQVKKSCNQHETRLMTGVVDSQNIKTGFNEVHAPVETIDALRTLISLSLVRPEAFKYGVLANDRLPGLLLYGPPGTGKTLLAKAVAKESKATVLDVSGAQIYEKYVGEGEKMVRAVFTLAKKLSPCVVFIDEADAIFGSRSNAGNRNTHREIINQFLREWDGLDDHGVFIMVASNRPFDLDDAVLRRLPRRLLVDLPVTKDRESILGIHLKHETLDPAVSLAQLADQTPFYSGSDLKNLCVSAALACVREENALAEQHKDDETFKLPEKRTLTAAHFDKAIAEISASISEDMSSLTAIRKFDERFGDRRGRGKKSGYGFASGDGAVDESSVRVRSAQPPPP